MKWSIHPVHRQYEVSTCGLVRLVGKTRARKTRPDKYGYERINISNGAGGTKTVHVHTFVAETHLGPAPGMTVNHKDGDKKNNAVENLEWMSPGDNASHSFKSGHRVNRRCLPLIVDGRRFYSVNEAARATGVDWHTVRARGQLAQTRGS